MKIEDFKKICKDCGYAKAEVVEEYCQGKTNLPIRILWKCITSSRKKIMPLVTQG